MFQYSSSPTCTRACRPSSTKFYKTPSKAKEDRHVITRRSLINLGWLSLVNILWASQFPAYKVATEHMSVGALSFYTFVFAILILLPFLWKERRAASRGSRVSTSQPSDFKAWVLLAVIGILPPSVLMSWGIEHSSGSNAAILTLTIPILMLVIAVPLLGERLTWTRIGTLLLALVGTVFVSRDDLIGGKFTMSTLLGNLVILAACGGSAFYNIYSKHLLARNTELEVLVYGYVFAAVFCAGASLYLDPRPFYDVIGLPLSTWIAIGTLGGLTWGISMVLFMWLLKHVDLGQVSVSIYLLSFFGVLMSAVMLGEHVRPSQIVGGLIVATAALLADSYERRRAGSAEAA
jgi:drug/metabolite transporter (DMT)-like permease